MTNTRSRVRKLEIDLSNVSGYIEGEYDKVIIGALKSHKLYSPDFLYTVLDGDKLDILEREGTYRSKGDEFVEDTNAHLRGDGINYNDQDIIYAFNLANFKWEDGSNPDCIKTFQAKYINPALAVWDRSQFEEDYFASTNEGYRFKNPDRKQDALVAIVNLRM